MARMTGKKAFMEMLKAEGVEYIFGNPGTAEGPILDELENYPNFKYLLATQEGVAMGMADAYARYTGRPAFVSLHIDSGLANGVSLLTNAYEGGTPLVLTSANKDVRKQVEGRSDLVQMVTQFTKWSTEVTHAEQVPGAMRRAFNEAKTPPTGPTYLAFSANALDGEADMEIVPSPRGYFRTAPDGRAVQDAAEILAGAGSPVMIVGDRVGQSGAAQEAVRVAELLGARVYATTFSQVNFPTSHPQFHGMINPTMPAGRALLESADAVLAVGTSVFSGFFHFSGRALNPSAKLIHLDSNSGEIGKSEPTDVGIISDTRVGLGELADALDATMSGSAKEAAKGRSVSLAEEKAAQKAAWDQRVKDRWDVGPMSTERMMTEIASALPGDTIIVDDSITTRASVMGAMDFDDPGSILGITGGALGWGMGGTLGVKLANPDRPVVGIIGDGSAMMTVQALWTAANAGIPAVYVICNNRSYRVLKLNMDVYKSQILKEQDPQSQYLQMDFPTPLNLAGMAEAMGMHGRRIEDPAELAGAIKEALALGKPALLDVSIDGSV
ncbi:MAG: thiamine pyrophosphate-binding protein [Chloroflexi bacterium]|nr:thiamine pyrophosphate-binding protein [Chloroflexota bacterium]